MYNAAALTVSLCLVEAGDEGALRELTAQNSENIFVCVTDLNSRSHGMTGTRVVNGV